MLGVEIDKWVVEIQGKWDQIPSFEVDPQKLKHLVIICDGNRRAAEERKLPVRLGHQAGLEVIRSIARAGRQWGVNTLTFWVWSTENWERDKRQVDFVMRLARQNLSEVSFKEELMQNEINFRHLGRVDRLSPTLRRRLHTLQKLTASHDHFHLNLALDYGGQDEIIRAILRMKKSSDRREFDFDTLQTNPSALLNFLDSANQSLPDLVN